MTAGEHTKLWASIQGGPSYEPTNLLTGTNSQRNPPQAGPDQPPITQPTDSTEPHDLLCLEHFYSKGRGPVEDCPACQEGIKRFESRTSSILDAQRRAPDDDPGQMSPPSADVTFQMQIPLPTEPPFTDRRHLHQPKRRVLPNSWETNQQTMTSSRETNHQTMTSSREINHKTMTSSRETIIKQ